MKKIIKKLIDKGIRLSEIDGQLKVQLGGAFLSTSDKEAITENKEEIIEYLKGKKVSFLSFAQERLWFLAELGYSREYHIPGLLRIKNGFNTDSFVKTLDYIIERHESFRTGFQSLEGKAIQVVHQSVETPFEIVDLTHLSSEESIKEAEKLKIKFLNTTFDLEKPPLFRAILIKISDTDHILGLCMHHIISDGWSIQVLVNEINHVYNAYFNGKEPMLDPLKLQYMDYTIWQHGLMSGDNYQNEINYWKEQLADLEDLDLPTDFTRPAQISGEGESISLNLDDETGKIITGLTKELRVSTFTLLLAGVYILLNKYSRQTNFGMGMPVANRNNKEVEGLVGFFVNTLVVNVKDDQVDQLTVKELILKIQQAIIDGQDNQNLPFDKIVDELSPERDLSRTPVFQVIVNSVFESANLEKNTSVDTGQESILDMIPEEMDYNPAKFDLAFDLNAGENDKYVVTINYAIDLFNHETVATMTNYLGVIFKAMKSQLNEKFLKVNLLESNKNEEIARFSKHQNKTGDNFLIHDLIDEAALKNPAHPAIILSDKTVSYKELKEKSDLLAVYLQSKNIGAESLVAVSMQSNDELIVAILGILKAGAAYVPIDPLYPEERVNYILEDSKSAIIITNQHTEEKLKECFSGLEKVLIDKDWDQISNSQTSLNKVAKPDNLAYIIYTSGSTGKPKGVMTMHKNVIRIIKDMNYIDISSSDRTMQMSNFTFDGSVFEIFATLTNGASLAMIPKSENFKVDDVAEFILEKQLTISFMTTALFNAMVDGHMNVLKTLRKITFGGERVSVNHVNKALEILPENTLVHLYGPTETTVYATYFPIEKKKYVGNVPIGFPMNNTELYVLNESHQIQPIGIPGELYIAGEGVARGYLNKEELTKERFIDNPFKPGTIMYKSGDLVKWNHQHAIEFIGRVDDQVKVRGYRIELGEIENALVSQDSIASAAVVVREAAAGKQLIAYYTGEEVKETVLKDFLLKSLPEYMVPLAFVKIDKIPLTATGKINRRLLSSRKVELSGSGEFKAAETDTQIAIAEIWKELLEIEQISIYDSFFELGGHSLLVTQLLSRVNSEFSAALTLRQIFENPTIAAIARLTETGSGDSNYQPLEKVERPEFLPLSFAQERLWFLDEMGQGDQYHIPGISVIKGEFHFEAFQKAINDMIARHENLRTCFKKHEDEPYQFIYPELKIAVEKSSMTGKNVADPEIKEKIKEFITKPFLLNQGPLIRAMIVSLGDKEHLLGICIHHIIADGWSMGVIIDELNEFYKANLESRAAKVGELKVQYGDYTLWQKKTFSEEKLDNELTHWENHMSGYEDLAMPTDFSRPRELSGKGDTIGAFLDKNVAALLKIHSQKNGSTVFSSLLAGVYAILNKYSGQKDFSIGTPVANRNHRDIENLIGFFVNTVVNRIIVDPNKSLSELQLRVKEELFRSQNHQDVPFEKIVDKIQPARDLSRTPLFQVMVNYINLADKAIEFGKATIEGVELDYKSSKFDLNFTFSEHPTGDISFSIEYSGDLYTKETIEGLIKHLQTLFKAFAEYPGQKISDISLLDEKESKLILEEFNHIHEQKPVYKTIHSVLDEVTHTVSDRVAVRALEGKLTYQELKEKSDALALYMHKQGIRKDDLIAISLDRSLDLVVTILAVLKAGGAYFSIDPAYPLERKEQILADSEAKVLVSNGKYLEELKGSYNGTIIDRSSKESLTEIASVSGVLIPPMNPEGLSYVIYTSGSTGKPKGVLQTHQTIVNLVEHQHREYGYDIAVPKEVSQFASASFDVSVQEIFFTLLSGYTLNIVSEDVKYSTEKMLGFVMENSIEIAYLPTAYLEYFCREFLQSENQPVLSKLERIIVAGEALKINETIREFFKINSNIALENQYGPSETHVVTALTLAGDSSEWPELPLIGKPIHNIKAFILDQEMHAVPMGAIGELYFSGAGIARSYLKNETLSQEKFIISPFDESPMYRTGDLARWRITGDIQFLGRADDQVKVRGFRIELGEIETAIAAYAAVESAAVVAKQIDGNVHLIAFFTTKEENQEIAENDLKTHLTNSLPDYMIPASFKQIDQIPLTINGKVNRKQLTQIEVAFSSTTEYVAPSSQAEEILSGIWKELLKLDQVGITDNFFELGGHSLLATQVISRINRKFSVAIELKELFNSPTISQLSKLISSENVVVDNFPLKKYDRPEFIPLSFAQERLWFLNELGQGYQYHMPDVLTLNGEFNKEAFIFAINHVVDRHENLRTVFAKHNDSAYQNILPKLDVPLNHMDLKGVENQTDKINQVVKEFVNAPFDLENGPLLKTLAIELKEDNFVIGICMHHIISDGWSLKILLREISHSYYAFLENKQPSLKPLPVQYGDYALWQKDKYADGKLEEAIAHWKSHLEGYEDLNMPTDFVRPRQISGRGKFEVIKISESVSKALKDYCNQSGITLFSGLLTGVYALLNAYTHQNDLCVGMPVANRTDENIEDLIGFFVNTLVNRIQIDEEASLEDLQKAVTNEIIRSQNYQDVPFEKIVEAVKPTRDMSRTPIFQVMASYVKPEEATKDDSETTSEGVKVEYNISKFELNFVFSERGNNIVTTLEYNTDLYQQETIFKLVAMLELFLEALALSSEKSISQIPLLAQKEGDLVLNKFNEGTAYPAVKDCLHHLFSKQALETPDANALYFNGQSMTYGELDRKSTKLALYLQALGVDQSSKVAISLEKSFEMIVGIVGILKSGGSYVPIDPTYPEERIGYILEDSGSGILISTSELKEKLKALADPKTIHLAMDSDELLFEACDGHLSDYAKPSDIAYVIYTSGSTGKPKGTLIRHDNVLRVCKYPNYIDINKEDKILQLSNFAFDGSVFDIFSSLLNGAGLVLISKEIMMSTKELSNFIKNNGITVSFMTTALFNSLIDHSMETLKGLRKILFGGEQVSVIHVNEAISKLGKDRIIHVYGPTETTVYATYYPVNEDHYIGNVPIGKPLTGTGLYVLNKSLLPVPIGVIGELYISGDGLAQGYHNRPELTDERFINSPFVEGEKLYKTGDLVKWNSSGNILFEGRADQQVKVRGFRIELGEVESVVAGFDAIKRCAVIARLHNGTKQLIAFYTSEEPVDIDGLRSYMNNLVPEYMIPTAFDRLEEIPLTNNGKTNVKALENIEVKLESSQEYIAPETDIEKQLVAIWEEVLKVEQVGMLDNFFELGGHSLLATQIVSRINKDLSVEISLSKMLEEPSVKALAVLIGDTETDDSDSKFAEYEEGNEEIIL